MKWLVPGKKSKNFGFPGDILKITPNPSDFWNNHYWGTHDRGVRISLCLLCKSSHHAFPEMDKKLKSYLSSSMQSTSCGEIIIYDSEKAYKDYNIFSTMYKKCKNTLSYHHSSSYFSILRVNHTQNSLINNEKLWIV